MRDSNTLGYWFDLHIQPDRLGYGERYTFVAPLRLMGDLPCAELTARHLAEFRDLRLTQVREETVRREMRAIRRALTIARNELEAPLPSIRDLFERVRLPPTAPHRDRRLAPEEEAALFAVATEPMRDAMTLALETAMRRRELCSVEPHMVDVRRGVIHLPRSVTKTKRQRVVPLTERAAAAAERALWRGHDTMLGMTTNAVNIAWQRTRREASKIVRTVETYRWHDFRHECLSRLAQRGWSALELQAVSGHSTPAMLGRYVNLRADDLVDKIRRE